MCTDLSDNSANQPEPPDTAPREPVASSILTAERLSQLTECEHTLKEALVEGVFRAGLVLRKIRDEKLYRETHLTFESYLRDRWEWSYSHIHRLIEAATIRENLATSPIGEIVLPTAESQVRPLGRFKKNPEKQRRAWEKALTIAEGRVPTAKDVRDAVQSIAPPKSLGSASKPPKQAKAERIIPEESDDEAMKQEPMLQKKPDVGPAAPPQTETKKPDSATDSAPNDTTDFKDTSNDPRPTGGEPSSEPGTSNPGEHTGSQPTDNAPETVSEIGPLGVPPVVDARPTGDETTAKPEGPAEPGSCPPTEPPPSPGREDKDVGTSSAGTDSDCLKEGEPNLSASVNHLSPDRFVPERLVQKTLNKIAAATDKPSATLTARRQRVLLGVVETLERMSKEDEAMTLIDAFDASQYALKFWLQMLDVEKPKEKKRRNAEKG